jgi:hypothetical protein
VLKRSELGAAAVITAAAVIVYRATLSAYFLDDDFQWFVTKSTFHLREVFWPIGLSRFFRPVIEMYFSVATPLFGHSTFLFHGANLVLHIANGLLVFTLVRIAWGGTLPGFVAALLFVVQPSDIDGIAWVAGLIEAVATFFGCVSFIAWLQYRRTSRAAWRTASLVAFALALLSHESAVVFLPLLVLADWAFVEGFTLDRATVRRYVPQLLMVIAYLLADYLVNRTHVVVQQGTYAFGWHGLQHALDYLVDLYVGQKNLANYVLIVVALGGCLLSRRPRLIFAVAWLLMTLLPFVFFTWENTSRYLYLPAVGFSMLAAEAILGASALLARRFGARTGQAAVAILTAVMAVRFALFAITNVEHFVYRTEAFRQYAIQFDEIHGAEVRPHAVIAEDPRLNLKLPPQFTEALVRWQYSDPTIRLAPRSPR